MVSNISLLAVFGIVLCVCIVNGANGMGVHGKGDAAVHPGREKRQSPLQTGQRPGYRPWNQAGIGKPKENTWRPGPPRDHDLQLGRQQPASRKHRGRGWRKSQKNVTPPGHLNPQSGGVDPYPGPAGQQGNRKSSRSKGRTFGRPQNRSNSRSRQENPYPENDLTSRDQGRRG